MATSSSGARKRLGTHDGGGSAAAGPLVRIGARRPPWRLAVGSVLRDWRTDQGLRLADVAQLARVSVQYLSEVERGRKEPSSEVLGAVTQALGGSLTDLALGVARHLSAADDRRRVVTPVPDRVAQVRELRAVTAPRPALRTTPDDPSLADAGLDSIGLDSIGLHDTTQRGDALLLAA